MFGREEPENKLEEYKAKQMTLEHLGKNGEIIKIEMYPPLLMPEFTPVRGKRLKGPSTNTFRKEEASEAERAAAADVIAKAIKNFISRKLVRLQFQKLIYMHKAKVV